MSSRLLLLLLAALPACTWSLAPDFLQDPGPMQTRRVPLLGLPNEVYLDGALRVSITTCDTCTALIAKGHKEHLDRLNVSQESRKLKLDFTPAASAIEANATLELSIPVVPNLALVENRSYKDVDIGLNLPVRAQQLGLRQYGSARLRVNGLNHADISLDCNGLGEIEVAGSTLYLYAGALDLGRISAYGLEARMADLFSNSQRTGRFTVVDTARARLMSTGDIHLSRQPLRLTIDARRRGNVHVMP